MAGCVVSNDAAARQRPASTSYGAPSAPLLPRRRGQPVLKAVVARSTPAGCTATGSVSHSRFSSQQQQQQQQRGHRRPRAPRPCCSTARPDEAAPALASADGADSGDSGSSGLEARDAAIIEAAQAERQTLRSLEILEVAEPAVEERAESAALAVAAAVAFGAGVWAILGRTKGEEYFAGYLLEQSLSVDNLFVFVLVFSYFKTPVAYQSKVLTYGIATAAVLRLVLIVMGVDIVEHFKPVLLLFSGILLFSSFKLLSAGDADEDEDLSDNKIVQMCRKVMTFSDSYDGDRFFTTVDGKTVATPLLLVLLVVELSDVIFAVDSIPAVFGVTLDPFIVYSSNLFAILSLRGLYGFVSTFMSKLRYLDKAVAVVLGFVGAKIILDFVGLHIPTDTSLAAVAGILATGVGASLLLPGATESEEQGSADE